MGRTAGRLEGDNSSSCVFLKTLTTKLSTTKPHRAGRPHQQGLPQDGAEPRAWDAPAQPSFSREPAAPSILSAPPLYAMSPGTTHSPPDTRLSWQPGPAHPRAQGRNMPSCHVLYGKRLYLVFISLLSSPCIYKFSIKKCLLECELRSLSLSDTATHALTASRPPPPADEWKFPLKRAAALASGVGKGRGREGLCSLPCSIVKPL